MIPKESKIKTVQLDGGESLFVLDFVADAINGFLKSYDQALSNGKISRQDQILSSLVPVKGYTNVLEEKTLTLRDGTKNTIVILCIAKHKFIQTVIYSYNGDVNVSLVQMFEPTPTGGKPAECYKSNITN